MNRKEFIKKGFGSLVGLSILNTPLSISDIQSKKNESIKNRLLKVFKKKMVSANPPINWKKFNWNGNLTKDYGFDSLDFVECIMEVEKEFSITIPDEIAEKLITPKKVLDYLTSVL